MPSFAVQKCSNRTEKKLKKDGMTYHRSPYVDIRDKLLVLRMFICPTILSIFSICSIFAQGENRSPRLKIGLPEGRIVGGHTAAPHSYPYQISLQMRLLWLRAHICGGSLLNDYWILTAAHCVSESFLISLLPLDAVAGAHDVVNLGYSSQISRVDKRIPHPLYQGGVAPNDIAILRVKSPFVYSKAVQPIKLPRRDFSPDTRSLVTLTGWGLLRTSFFPDMPTNLQEVKVPIVPFQECYQAIEQLKDTPSEVNPLSIDSNLCTGPLTGGVAACNGDSGGPLVQFLASPEDKPDDADEEDVIDNDEAEEIVTSGGNTTTPSTSMEKMGKNKKHKMKTRPCMVEFDKNENGTPLLIGIVSWGMSPCGSDGAPTVYTNVANFLEFIETNIY